MKPQIPWLRVFVEGVVIVGSILLAFGLRLALCLPYRMLNSV